MRPQFGFQPVPVHQIVRMVREVSGPTLRGEVKLTEPAAVETVHRAPPTDELDALVLLVSRPEVALTEEAGQILNLLRDLGLQPIYAAALDTLRAGGRPDVPAWLDSGPADIRQAVGAALMDGRWAKVEVPEEAMRALAMKLDRRRIDEEFAQAQRQYREALARGDEEEARAFSVKCIELKQTKLGLANQSRGMTT